MRRRAGRRDRSRSSGSAPAAAPPRPPAAVRRRRPSGRRANSTRRDVSVKKPRSGSGRSRGETRPPMITCDGGRRPANLNSPDRPYNQHSLSSSANRSSSGSLDRIERPALRPPCPSLPRSNSIPRGVSMNLRPLHDRVIVKRLDRKPRRHRASSSPTTRPRSPIKAKSSPSVPASAATRATWLPLSVKVGDRVLFGKYSGQTVKVDGEELMVMREEDIMAVVEARQVTPYPERTAPPKSPVRPAPKGNHTWQLNKFSSATTLARRSSTASTSSPTRSRSRSARRAATSCSSARSAHPPSRRTASRSRKRSS